MTDIAGLTRRLARVTASHGPAAPRRPPHPPGGHRPPWLGCRCPHRTARRAGCYWRWSVLERRDAASPSGASDEVDRRWLLVHEAVPAGDERQVRRRAGVDEREATD